MTPGQNEISFGAVPVDTEFYRGKVVGCGPNEAGISLYGIGYRTVWGGGWIAAKSQTLQLPVLQWKPINSGSVFKANWTASSRTLSFEVDGLAVGSAQVPMGNHMFAATCDGSGASIGPLVSFALPAKVLTLQWSDPTAEGIVQVQATSLGGDQLAAVTLRQDQPFKDLLDALFMEIFQRPRQLHGQNQMVKLVTVDGYELSWSSDTLPFAEVVSNGS